MMPSIIAGEKTWCSSSTQAFQTVGRSDTGIRKLCERSQTIGILSGMDIHIDVCALCHLKGIGHLEAVTTGHAESCQQLIEVGRTVGRAHLYSLLDARVVFRFLLQGVGLVTHVHIGSPAQRHAHQHRAVPIAPAYVCRCFLMGHLTGSLRQYAVGQHLVLAVLHHPHVDMQA